MKINQSLGREAEKFIYLTPHPAQMSNHSLIVNAGQGTSGTRSVFVAIARQGYKSTHFRLRAENGKFYASNETHKDEIFGPLLPSKRLDSDYAKRCPSFTAGAAPQVFDFKMWDNYDALHDVPFPEYWYDLFITHPNSRILWSYREPREWARKRMNINRKARNNAKPAILHPCTTRIKSLTVQQNENLYNANFKFFKCIVPPERQLVMNVFKNHDTDQDKWQSLCSKPWLKCKKGLSWGQPFPHKSNQKFSNRSTSQKMGDWLRPWRMTLTKRWRCDLLFTCWTLSNLWVYNIQYDDLHKIIHHTQCGELTRFVSGRAPEEVHTKWKNICVSTRTSRGHDWHWCELTHTR